MATRSAIRSLVRTYISQTDTGNTDFTDSDLNGFIDEAVRKLAAIVKKPTKRTSFQVTDGTATYAIATYAADLILPTKAYFGNPAIGRDVKPLRIIPEESLAELNPSWLETTSDSKGRPEYLIKDGTDLRIHPRPDATEGASGKLVYLTFVYQPAAIASDSAEPDMPLVYHDLVSIYAAHLCWGTKLNNVEKADYYLNLVYAQAKKYEELIVKESVSFGFTWGNTLDPDDDGIMRVNP